MWEVKCIDNSDPLRVKNLTSDVQAEKTKTHTKFLHHVGVRLRVPGVEGGLPRPEETCRLHQRLQTAVLAGQHRS